MQHSVSEAPLTSDIPRPRTLSVTLAQSLSDLQAAQRLRYQVFVEEMGAQLDIQTPGLEFDHYDRHCQHLLVRDARSHELVGYTRLLTSEQAQRAGGFYSEGEFELDAILGLSGRFLEIGRTCIHPDYRNGATLAALWSGLAQFIEQHAVDYLIGCASLPLGENGQLAWSLYQELRCRYLLDPALQVTPRVALPETALLGRCPALPPLLKGYLRAGALIGGHPYLDQAFGVADVLVFLPTVKLSQRYARHFLGSVA